MVVSYGRSIVYGRSTLYGPDTKKLHTSNVISNHLRRNLLNLRQFKSDFKCKNECVTLIRYAMERLTCVSCQDKMNVTVAPIAAENPLLYIEWDQEIHKKSEAITKRMLRSIRNFPSKETATSSRARPAPSGYLQATARAIKDQRTNITRGTGEKYIFEEGYCLCNITDPNNEQW